MQDSSGGWAAFDADNKSALVRELPFCDFGEVIDPPSADVTAHALEMLAEVGRADTPAARRGLSWLAAEQEPGGSWFGRWAVNHVYGTGAAVPALIAAGVPAADLRIRRAVRWLEEHQNDDGGWGEDVRSYDRPGVGRARREHGLADGVGAARAARGRRALGRGHAAASTGSSERSARTAAGTSRSTRAPGSRATSRSTTTSTASCSRSWPWGA